MGSRGAFVDVNMNDFTFKVDNFISLSASQAMSRCLYKQKVLSKLLNTPILRIGSTPLFRMGN